MNIDSVLSTDLSSTRGSWIHGYDIDMDWRRTHVTWGAAHRRGVKKGGGSAPSHLIAIGGVVNTKLHIEDH